MRRLVFYQTLSVDATCCSSFLRIRYYFLSLKVFHESSLPLLTVWMDETRHYCSPCYKYAAVESPILIFLSLFDPKDCGKNGVRG